MSTTDEPMAKTLRVYWYYPGFPSSFSTVRASSTPRIQLTSPIQDRHPFSHLANEYLPQQQQGTCVTRTTDCRSSTLPQEIKAHSSNDLELIVPRIPAVHSAPPQLKRDIKQTQWESRRQLR